MSCKSNHRNSIVLSILRGLPEYKYGTFDFRCRQKELPVWNITIFVKFHVVFQMALEFFNPILRKRWKATIDIFEMRLFCIFDWYLLNQVSNAGKMSHKFVPYVPQISWWLKVIQWSKTGNTYNFRHFDFLDFQKTDKSVLLISRSTWNLVHL